MAKLIPLSEYARQHGITRIAAYYRYKKGTIPTQKIGRHIFYIEDKLTSPEKKLITKAIKRAITEFGNTLERLGDE